jgi:hypothetical protein
MPLWASLLKFMNAQRGSAGRVGFLGPLLYAPQRGLSGSTVGTLGCTDVTSGRNDTDQLGGYSAGVGYDAISGWGVPNGQKLLAALGSTSSSFTSSGSGRPGKKRKPPPQRSARETERLRTECGWHRCGAAQHSVSAYCGSRNIVLESSCTDGAAFGWFTITA